MIYLVALVAIRDTERVHGPDHRLHRHENVLVDKANKRALVLFRVATAVDNSHLLDKRGLAGLAGACNDLL